MFRGLSAIALAAAVAPFVFFTLVAMSALGLAAISFGPLILTFVAWMVLGKWARREAKDRREAETLEARVIRESPPQFPAEAYSPPAHFDLLLVAKHDIGRIRGAITAMEDGAIAQQFRNLAERADSILARLMAEPVKLGLARRFLASYLPRAADLAAAYPRFTEDDSRALSRRTKLLDVLYRLDVAMKEQEAGLAAPEMTRLDADLRLLTDDLKDYTPDFTKAPEPILSRVDEIVKAAKKKDR